MLIYYLLTLLSLRYQLLIAGSSGWQNYRHQSDVMALSSLLHTDPSNIVTTMIRNDIVNHKNNPYPGKLFNTINTHPSFNIYNRDYINTSIITLNSMKEQLSRFNFSSDDIITIYYNNHGAPGLLCSPSDSTFDSFGFFADDIEETLQHLSRTGAKILFIIESCYAGSVAKYISIPNVLVIAASNSIESSYAAKFSNKLNAFVSNLFTLNLINYLNDPYNSKSSLIDFVNYLSKNTLRSTVGIYGDKYHSSKLMKRTIGDIFGHLQSIPRDDEYTNEAELLSINRNSQRSQNSKLFWLMNSFHSNPLIFTKYYNELMRRRQQQQLFKTIVSNIADSLQQTGLLDQQQRHDSRSVFELNEYTSSDFKLDSNAFNAKFNYLPEEIVFRNYTCYKRTTSTYKRHCGEFGDAEFDQLLPVLARICYHYPKGVHIINQVIRETCKSDRRPFHR